MIEANDNPKSYLDYLQKSPPFKWQIKTDLVRIWLFGLTFELEKVAVVVGFTITYAISVYHHWSCVFESHWGEVYSIQHYVIRFVSDSRQVGGFLRTLRFHPPIKLTATI
jgi:hypothetical protein